MRICFVLPPVNLSGGIRVIAIYADRLHRRGHDVQVVSVSQSPPRFRRAVKTLIRDWKWPYPRQQTDSYFDHLQVPHRVLRKYGPVTDADIPDGDVVVATWWQTAEWVNQLSPSKGAKAHFMQDYEIWSAPPELVDASCRLPIPKIVIADWVSKLLEERFEQTPLTLVPNSVDTGFFCAPPRSKQAVPTIGFTYFKIRSKGTDITVKAIELARREVPDLRVIAMGYDEATAELPLPVGTEFRCRAPEAELPSIYASCDAWLFGTRIEGFGLPLLEAMACRTPVIGTPAGAAPELLNKGGGSLIPAEDPQAMANAIVQICRMTPEAWQALSDRALATVTGYTWDDATDRFEAALQQVVAQTRNKG